MSLRKVQSLRHLYRETRYAFGQVVFTPIPTILLQRIFCFGGALTVPA